MKEDSNNVNGVKMAEKFVGTSGGNARYSVDDGVMSRDWKIAG